MDFANPHLAKGIKLTHDGSCVMMSFLAIFCYYFGITFEPYWMVLIILLVHVQMSVCDLFELKARFGSEYISYLTNSGAVYMGQYDYELISN